MTTHPDDLRDEVPDESTDPLTDPAAAVEREGKEGDPRPPTDLVRSVSRALAVLEVIGSSATAMSAKAVSRRTGLNLSTTYHLLRTLSWENYLVRLPSGDYRLGAGVTRRYRDLVAAIGAPPPVRHVLTRLSGRTGYTGFLGRTIDGRVAITDVVEGARAPQVAALAPGFDDVVEATPLGHVLQPAPATGGGQGGDPPSRLLIEDGRLQSDVSCAAVSVRRPAPGEPVASTLWAIGLSGPLGCFTGGSPALMALLQAAEQLAGALHSGARQLAGLPRPSAPADRLDG